LGGGAAGIIGYTGGNTSRVKITNDGDIATAGAGAAGIVGITGGNRSHVNVTNNGDVATVGFNAYGVYAYTYGPNSNIKVSNDGTIGASSSINNSGLITGFVDLTDSSDTFTNMLGG
jgi:autotransporter family porin